MLKRIITFTISLIVFMTTISANSVIDLIHQEEDFYCIEISNFYKNLKSCDYIIEDFFEEDIKKMSDNEILYNDFEINIKRIELFKEVLKENDMESENINKYLKTLYYIKDDYIKLSKEDATIKDYLNLYSHIKGNIKENMLINDDGELEAEEYIKEEYKTNLIEDMIKSKNKVLLNFVEIIDAV